MSFEQLFRKLSPKLKGITYKLNGRFAFFNADDLFQEALLYLWLMQQSRQLDDKTDSYILQGCYFHLKNYIRKYRDKAELISLDNVAGPDDEPFCLESILPAQAQDSVLELTHYKMLVERINNNGLTKREKEVFNLSLEGLTVREIGAKLGISHVRVVKLKGLVRDKCKKHLD